jgi:hypothetical protein
MGSTHYNVTGPPKKPAGVLGLAKGTVDKLTGKGTGKKMQGACPVLHSWILLLGPRLEALIGWILGHFSFSTLLALRLLPFSL